MSEMDPPEIQQETSGSSRIGFALEASLPQAQRSESTKITNIIDYNRQGIDTSQAKPSLQLGHALTKPMEIEEPREDEKVAVKGDQQQQKQKKQQKKCALCKKQVRKPESKMCRGCHRHFHLVCINLEKETAPKKYICERCQFQGEEDRSTKHQRKEEKQLEKQADKQLRLDGQYKSLWLTDKKKQDRERRNGDYHQVLNLFTSRYPSYVKDRELKFPIDDVLLLVYSQLFDPEKKIPEAGYHSEIPSALLGDFMLVENFVLTFLDEIKYPFETTSKRFMHRALSLPYGDRVFYAVLSSLLTVYLGDIMEKNKTENVRALNDHSFFILVSNLFENQCFEQLVPVIWREVVYYLSQVPSMAKAFEGFDRSTPTSVLEGKLYILRTLIEGLSEIDSFHDMVSKKSERMQQMTKERGELVTELKKEQAQVLSMGEKMKELEHQDRQLQIQIDQLTKKYEPTNKQQRQQQRIRKQVQKMEQTKQRNQESIQKNKERINDINKTICFVTTGVQFLGIDRNSSEYFLSAKEPNTMYVKYNHGLLDSRTNYRLYEGKQRIVEVMHALNCKGIREKSLHDSIHYFIKEGVIRDSPEEPFEMTEENLLIEGDQVSFDSIKLEVNEIEKRFTSYLSLRNCRWAHRAIRQSFMEAFMTRVTLTQLKEDVRQLQESFLFVESFQERNTVIPVDEESEEYYRPEAVNKSPEGLAENEEEEYDKKLPIRLWGINSEKIKKFWSDYLQNCSNLAGLWICVWILRNFVERYIKKKQEGMEEREKKKQRERQKEKQKERQRREREKEQKHQSSPNQEVENESEDGRPALRRLFRKSERRQKYTNLHQVTLALTQPSSDSEQDESEGSNQDACEICEGEGEVLCCDTCPKAYHLDCLKLKQVPEGEWSCYKCLQRLANERQTRSRSNKNNRVLLE